MKLKHDGTIDIATAKRRTERRWKNAKITWADLAERLQETHRTHESLTEYLKMSKDRQDDIKDVGGFVGGYLDKGRRMNGSVRHRQLLTLDIDKAGPDFWADFQMAYECAALLYSTHKHQPESPRLRLLMPLSRTVNPEEYQAIARRIAGVLGIDQFDPTTYQPARLMYWPSTAKNGEYVYELQDGIWLDADEILASYVDWTDTSSWPVSEAENDSVRRGIKRAGDPLEKPGTVGAFCRTYTIQEAIDAYLSDVYSPSQHEDRYTFSGGSTSGGLVVYEDKFAFSHHGTDPTSGQLCNSFDLVRLHLYGHLDEDSDRDAPVNKRPSYAAMIAKSAEDALVKKTTGEERLDRARDIFLTNDAERAEEAPDHSWMARLEMDDKGNYRRTLDNMILIMENDPNLKGRFAKNAFTDRDTVTGDLPWRKVLHDTSYFTDIDLIGLCHYLESTYGIDHKGKIKDAAEAVLYRHRHHPVREYLEALDWDGQKRLDTVLIDYLGAQDNTYTRTVTRKTLVAAVARIMEPGCKFDYVLTLVGRQGSFKSTLIRKLGMQWYCENLTTVQGKEAAEQIRGVWLQEMGELAGLRKAEVEVIKNYISRTEDSYRPAYGVKKETYARQCIFIGTTNNDDFLRDPTGNRRFWPVPVDRDLAICHVPSELTQAEVDQIWAEALQAYRTGETLHLEEEEVEEMAREMQEKHTERDSRFEVVQQYLETPVPEDWAELDLSERRLFLSGGALQAEGKVKRTAISVAEIWCEALGRMIGDMTTNNTKPIHDIMKRMPGWRMSEKKMRSGIYGCQRVYRKTSN